VGDCRVQAEEVSNGADGVASKSVSFNVDVMGFQPFHHVVLFDHQLLEFCDHFGGVDVIPDHYSILADGQFQHLVDLEELVELLLFDGECFVSWEQCFVGFKGL